MVPFNTSVFTFSVHIDPSCLWDHAQNEPEVFVLCNRQDYKKTDDFVLELRQPKTEPLGGGVELVDYITGAWWV